MLPVARRTRIISGRNGVFAPNLPVKPFGNQFAAALVMQHPAGGIIGFFLRAVDARRLIRIVSFIGPTSVGTTEYNPIPTFTHNYCYSFLQNLGLEGVSFHITLAKVVD